jgi:hypothetical protein
MVTSFGVFQAGALPDIPRLSIRIDEIPRVIRSSARKR